MLKRYKSHIRNIHFSDEEGIPKINRYLRVPTLLLCSKDDYATRAEMGAASEKFIKGPNFNPDDETANDEGKVFKMVVLEGGHWILIEQPEEVVGNVDGFLKEVGVVKS